MFKKYKIISLLTIFTMLLCSIGTSAENIIDLNEYLLNAGFPITVVDNMSETQKKFIYDNTHEKNIRFCGYDTKDFVLDDNGDLVETKNGGELTPCGGLLSSSNITISVFGTTEYSADGITYSVFPTFVWHTVTKVKNDAFGMSMYSGWEAIPNQRNFSLYFRNAQGNSTSVDIAPTVATSSGYSYQIPSSTGTVQGLYEGYAYFDIDKVNSSASPRISLCYVHDNTPLFNASYGLNIGVGSITITGNTNNLYTMADNYEVSGLE